MYVCPYLSKSVCPEPKISVTANSDNYVVFGKYIYWSCVGLTFYRIHGIWNVKLQKPDRIIYIAQTEY